MTEAPSGPACEGEGQREGDAARRAGEGAPEAAQLQLQRGLYLFLHLYQKVHSV